MAPTLQRGARRSLALDILRFALPFLLTAANTLRSDPVIKLLLPGLQTLSDLFIPKNTIFFRY